MSIYENRPEPFFDVIVHDLNQSPGLTGLFAGYEGGEWRYNDMADYLFEWLPEFALKYTDIKNINSATAMRSLKRAAKIVYNTEKYQKRGEFGELLLHALIRETFDSQPAISKIYYKSSVNETVKGFDAVHIVPSAAGIELWLGEVKFYKEITSAIQDVVKEINDHIDRDYLKDEFVLISSKIDDSWEHAGELKSLIAGRKSLDEVFKSVCIPVLLTYESSLVKSESSLTDEFKEKMNAELVHHHFIFTEKELPDLKIHLFLVPLGEKQKLIDVLHSKLEGMQR